MTEFTLLVVIVFQFKSLNSCTMDKEVLFTIHHYGKHNNRMVETRKFFEYEQNRQWPREQCHINIEYLLLVMKLIIIYCRAELQYYVMIFQLSLSQNRGKEHKKETRSRKKNSKAARWIKLRKDPREKNKLGKPKA